ncbi:MAG: O-antigen ligase family protein [Synechococcus sp.]
MRRAILTQIFAPGDVRPGNVLEAAVFWPLALLYPIWFVGGLYLVGSVLGWLLGIILVLRILRSGINPIPLTLWVWIAGVLTIALTLFVAHNGYGRGTGTLIKSMVSWGRTWALLPLYLLAGCLPIRPQIVYRGAAIVCAWTLALLPAFMALKAIHFREVWFTSPLRVIGGPNALSFFQIGVYSSEDHGAGELRWKLFAPWSPALGLIGVCFFMLALQEKGGWRWIGLAGSVAMVLLSGSRLSLVCLPFVLVVSWCLQNLKRPMFLAGVGVASLLGGVGADAILSFLSQFYRDFKARRAGSSQVREDLQKIALFRWQEAPIWGHGQVEGGPITVAYMPIGSHHTWFGVLFVHGVVGLFALLVPMVLTLGELVLKANSSPVAMTGFRLMLTLCLFSFGENLEAIAYFYWPVLMAIGMALACKTPARGAIGNGSRGSRSTKVQELQEGKQLVRQSDSIVMSG